MAASRPYRRRSRYTQLSDLSRSLALARALSFSVSLFRRVSVCALCQLSFSAELAEKTAALVLDCDNDDYFSAEEVPLSVSLPARLPATTLSP